MAMPALLYRQGDFDGDGLNDILLGSPKDYGKVYLILASRLGTDSTISLSSADYTLFREEGVYSGTSVSSAGDINDDGFTDFLVGSPYNSEEAVAAGKSYLIFGGI